MRAPCPPTARRLGRTGPLAVCGHRRIRVCLLPRIISIISLMSHIISIIGHIISIILPCHTRNLR